MQNTAKTAPQAASDCRFSSTKSVDITREISANQPKFRENNAKVSKISPNCPKSAPKPLQTADFHQLKRCPKSRKIPKKPRKKARKILKISENRTKTERTSENRLKLRKSYEKCPKTSPKPRPEPPQTAVFHQLKCCPKSRKIPKKPRKKARKILKISENCPKIEQISENRLKLRKSCGKCPK